MKQLEAFRDYPKLKKIIIQYIISQLSEQDFLTYGAIFNNIDENKDGMLSIEELKNGLYNF